MGHHAPKKLDPNERLNLGNLAISMSAVWVIVGIIAIAAGVGVGLAGGIPDFRTKDDSAKKKAMVLPAVNHVDAQADQDPVGAGEPHTAGDHDHDHDHDKAVEHEDAHSESKYVDKFKDVRKTSPTDMKIKRVMAAYTVGYVFIMSFCLGGLFFVMVMYLTRAGWSVTSRRIAENMAKTIPLMALLAIPIVVAMWQGYLYHHWVHFKPDDTLVTGKLQYLNPLFFTIRYVLYFVVWIGLTILFCGLSRKQDSTKDWRITGWLQNLAAPGLILYAIATTFFAFDTIMSMDPHWFSTMFGVYYFAGTMMATFAFIILMAMGMQSRGIAPNCITKEHYQDLGKFLFAFVVFWAYIAYSQYMLIWYANLYEETAWFFKRGVNITETSGITYDSFTYKMKKFFEIGESWKWVSITLFACHFVLPFLGLMSKWVKRFKPSLAFWAFFLLIMHWIDMMWLIMPELERPMNLYDWGSAALISLGLFGLFKAMMLIASGVNKPMIPVGDPRLNECLNFQNL